MVRRRGGGPDQRSGYVPGPLREPRQALRLLARKGVIAPGSDADIVVLDPAAESVLTAADHVQNVDYTPYEGTPLCGGIAQVYLRGRLAVDGGRLMEELPAGAFIPRGKCQL